MKVLSFRALRAGVVAVVATAAVITGQLASFGAQTTPAKLTGEKLASTKGTAGSSANCTATRGSFTFTVTGKAKGPYPGTFTATGSVKVGKYAPTHYSATIHLTSNKGKVTIAESLAKATNKAFCLPGYGLAGLTAGYHATVTVHGRTSRLSGTATGAVSGGSAASSYLRQFIS